MRPSLGYRRLARSPVDLRLFFTDTSALAGGMAGALVERLAGLGVVDTVRRRGAEVSLRLTEDFIDQLGRELEGAAPSAIATVGGMDGRHYVVNFLNPNASKPLHVGHLRNAALGMAVAASLEACGARVLRQCYVCDIGRSVCEAMAGYEGLLAQHGQDWGPERAGLAPDQFVGRCYADYARASDAVPGRGAESGADPAEREDTVVHDRADELLAAWVAGEAEARRLWERVRSWALGGQEATLERLGARWDRVHHESASLAAVERLTAAGLASGAFYRGIGQEVLFDTGRSEYATLKLLREDGFPTEHARVIGLFLEEQAVGAPPYRWIVVCGDEWGAAGQAELDVARRFGAAELVERVEVFAHGMVTAAGSKMKSRDGQAVLIDELLDLLIDSAPVQDLLEEYGRPFAPEQLADMLVKGYFLSKRASKGLEFTLESFTDEASNPAWAVVRALCRGAASRARATVGAPSDPERYRTAVLQAFQLRQLVARSAEGFQGTSLMKFVGGFARWYLDGASDPRLDRVVVAVCSASLGTLGVAARGR
ncbi:arginine--tRNA ligase [Engelhardtia mirabilis]